MYRFLSALSFIFLPALLLAQTPFSTAETSIVALKNGAAIVRIYMNKPKSDLLNKTINNGQLEEKNRKSLEKTLADHEEDRKKYKKRVINAFRSKYTFTKLYFIHDYDQKRLKSGEKSGFFLNDNGEVDNNIVLDQANYFIFGRGNDDNTFIVFDKDGLALPKAFPDRYNRNVFQGMVSAFSNEDKLINYVSNLNKKHKTYLRKVKDEEDE